jgi:hypothetical protein
MNTHSLSAELPNVKENYKQEKGCESKMNKYQIVINRHENKDCEMAGDSARYFFQPNERIFILWSSKKEKRRLMIKP